MNIIKNIPKILWDIVKITFIIVILFPIPIFPFNFLHYSSFKNFDWNPLATIVGSIITGAIAWFAIFETSKHDRDARKFENVYKLYLEKLLEFEKYITFLKEINGSCSNKNLILATTPTKLEEEIADLKKLKKLSKLIQVFDTSVKIDFINIDSAIDLMLNILYVMIYEIQLYDIDFPKNKWTGKHLSKQYDAYWFKMDELHKKFKKNNPNIETKNYKEEINCLQENINQEFRLYKKNT